MSDFTKLKSYLDNINTNGASASTSNSLNSNALNGAKDKVFDFFNKNVFKNEQPKQSDQEQTESWFKEADSDPYCPKLVQNFSFSIHLTTL